MKVPIPALFCFCLSAFAQNTPPKLTPPPLPAISDDEVIAVFDDGTPFTMHDFKVTMAGMPETDRLAALMDRKNFVEFWAGIRKLAQMGEKQKLDQQSPAKEQLAFNRAWILGQAMMNAQLNSFEVPEDAVAKFYEANRERFKRVKVKAIYVAFGQTAPEGKKALTEDQARQKALSLLAQIRGDADFLKLVKENSDDASSRAKDGDFATLSASDTIPDAIRKAVFALKKGEVSDPVRQPNGFYLLRAEDIEYKPLQQAHNEIWIELRQQMYNKWLSDVKEAAKPKFPLPAFVNTTHPPAPTPAPAGK